MEYLDALGTTGTNKTGVVDNSKGVHSFANLATSAALFVCAWQEDPMKKSSSVAVTAVAAISMAIACGPGSRERQARVCVDRLNTVVPADLCQDTRRGGGL